MKKQSAVAVVRQWLARITRKALFVTIHKIQANNPSANPVQVEREVLEAQQAVRRAPPPPQR